MTSSSRGREQQISRLPPAGGSSGSGSYATDPDTSPDSQVWQTPTRHDQRTGTSQASASSSRLWNLGSHATVRPARAKATPAVRPTYYLPSFRVIRCELIAGPATGNIETPLIGVVVENQYAIDPDGVTRLVIPAGVEVHGIGKPSPIRDRIDGTGAWTLVWRTNDENNAMELTVNALALNRDYDAAGRFYGDAEKSPGILGRRFESVGDKLIQSALLASAAALTRDLKTYTSVLNPLTSEVVNQAKPTVGNALLEAGAAGTDSIAQKLDAIRKEIDEKGYYVAVLPVKEFYHYTKEPIDLRNARRPQTLAQSEKPVTNSILSPPGNALMRMMPETNLKPAATP
jgi:hypothetical protein